MSSSISATPMRASMAHALLQLSEPISNPVFENEDTMDSESAPISKIVGEEDVCNCRKSKCLKLYCQCFAAKITCTASCRCVACANTDDNLLGRNEAVKQILDRNPSAFDSKFKPMQTITGVGHKTGCRCRKSMCLKKYCECFQEGVPCNASCTCIQCCNSVSVVTPWKNFSELSKSQCLTVTPNTMHREEALLQTGINNLLKVKVDGITSSHMNEHVNMIRDKDRTSDIGGGEAVFAIPKPPLSVQTMSGCSDSHFGPDVMFLTGHTGHTAPPSSSTSSMLTPRTTVMSLSPTASMLHYDCSSYLTMLPPLISPSHTAIGHGHGHGEVRGTSGQGHSALYGAHHAIVNPHIPSSSSSMLHSGKGQVTSQSSNNTTSSSVDHNCTTPVTFPLYKRKRDRFNDSNNNSHATNHPTSQRVIIGPGVERPAILARRSSPPGSNGSSANSACSSVSSSPEDNTPDSVSGSIPLLLALSNPVIAKNIKKNMSLDPQRRGLVGASPNTFNCATALSLLSGVTSPVNWSTYHNSALVPTDQDSIVTGACYGGDVRKAVDAPRSHASSLDNSTTSEEDSSFEEHPSNRAKTFHSEGIASARVGANGATCHSLSSPAHTSSSMGENIGNNGFASNFDSNDNVHCEWTKSVVNVMSHRAPSDITSSALGLNTYPNPMHENVISVANQNSIVIQ